LDLREFQRRFAERVRALRVSRGLRQEDLEDYGLSWKSVQKIEYGITDPKVSTLLKLSRAFGVSLGELLEVGSPQARSPERPMAVHERPPRRYGRK